MKTQVLHDKGEPKKTTCARSRCAPAPAAAAEDQFSAATVVSGDPRLDGEKVWSSEVPQKTNPTVSNEDPVGVAV